MTFLAILLLASANAPEEIPSYRDGCTPAQWEAWSIIYNSDGTSSGSHDRSNRHCFFDDRADLSEYAGLDDNNDPYYRGVSVTIWNDDRSIGRTLWAMVGTDGHTDIRASWDGDELVTENVGHEPAGAFLGRTRTSFEPGGDFRFVMERSYDGGDTWISPKNVIEYLKTSGDPAAFGQEWAPRFASFAPSLVGEGGFVMLDGFAWGKFITNNGDKPVGFIFASVSPKESKWFWRTITWTFDKGVESVNDVALE